MLKNVNYNLMEEITQISQSLYRYDRYIEDAKPTRGGCSECSDVWTQLKQRHEEDLALLLAQLKQHVNDGVFDLSPH